MKKYICIILLIITLFILFIPTSSRAMTLTEMFESADDFLHDSQGAELLDKDNEEDAINTLYWILLGIAVAAAVICGMVMGIQFITSGTSGQAKVKEKLIPFGVGCVVVFGAFGIWKLALTMLDSAF